MNQTDLIISIASAFIMVLVGSVGYLMNDKLTRISNKSDEFEKIILETKSTLIDLKLELKPVATETKDIQKIMLYQKEKITPVLEKISTIQGQVDQQDKKIKDQDGLIFKMFEVVKKLVEGKTK